MAGPTHYDTLGVDPNADTPAVRRAYVALARQYHPDFHTSGGEAVRDAAEERMRSINSAWHVLGDTDRLDSVADMLRATPARGRMLDSLAATVEGSVAAIAGRSDEAVAAFTRALTFRYLRVDRARLQALYATLVGRDAPDARAASDAAFEVFSDVGAAAFTEVYATGMPPAEERRAAGS